MDEPNLGERVVEAFGHMDLYVILGVDKAATAAQLKKGYLRACLACHPDKQGDKDSAEAQAAQRKFVLLSAVHELLSDARRRQQYDETGEVSEADSAEFVRWEQVMRGARRRRWRSDLSARSIGAPCSQPSRRTASSRFAQPIKGQAALVCGLAARTCARTHMRGDVQQF